MLKTKYMVNPDVILREEDEAGALLFNPDTNQVKVVNTTGLFIWKQFSHPNSIAVALQTLKENFDEVPGDEVENDVQEFIETMVESGFIGTVEEK